jgi:hypothetical protein
MSKNVWLVREEGDDYHGSRDICAYTKEADANKRVEKLDREQKPCKDCGDKYSYFAYPIEVLEEFIEDERE